MRRGWVLGGLAIAAALLLAAAGIALLLRDDDAPPSVDPDPSLLDRYGEVGVTVEPPSGAPQSTCMLAARSDAEHARGLMEVTDPDLATSDGDGHDGMVFIYADDTAGGFWMRNTPMPLTVAYVDAGGRLVSSTDMEPCEDSSDCPSYPAAGSYRYAIEVPQGRLDDLGITSSARVRVGGDCA